MAEKFSIQKAYEELAELAKMDSILAGIIHIETHSGIKIDSPVKNIESIEFESKDPEDGFAAITIHSPNTETTLMIQWDDIKTIGVGEYDYIMLIKTIQHHYELAVYPSSYFCVRHMSNVGTLA